MQNKFVKQVEISGNEGVELTVVIIMEDGSRAFLHPIFDDTDISVSTNFEDIECRNNTLKVSHTFATTETRREFG